MKTKFDIIEIQSIVSLYVQDTLQAIREKGLSHFYRCLGTAGGAVALAYFLAGIPAGEIQAIEKQLKDEKMVSQYAGRYRDAKTQLDRISRSMPDPKNQDTWLQNVVRDSMRDDNIDLSSIAASPPAGFGGYKILAVTVVCRANFKQIGSWIARMENGKAPLYVSSLTVAKQEQNDDGINDVTVTVNTIVPKEGEDLQ